MVVAAVDHPDGGINKVVDGGGVSSRHMMMSAMHNVQGARCASYTACHTAISFSLSSSASLGRHRRSPCAIRRRSPCALRRRSCAVHCRSCAVRHRSCAVEHLSLSAVIACASFVMGQAQWASVGGSQASAVAWRGGQRRPWV